MPAADIAALASALAAGSKPGAGLFTNWDGCVPGDVLMVWPPKLGEVGGTVRTTEA